MYGTIVCFGWPKDTLQRGFSWNQSAVSIGDKLYSTVHEGDSKYKAYWEVLFDGEPENVWIADRNILWKCVHEVQRLFTDSA